MNTFTLDKVVPWGRSFEEYVSMFSLTGKDLLLDILGCADGPSSFNRELTERGGRAISVDPLYQFTKTQIARRINDVYDEVLEQTRKNRDDYVWDNIRSVEELGRIRMSAMQGFLNDYVPGLRCGRYLAGSLPSLPFADGRFQLALCSHFLFLYSDHLSLEFHISSILEMCRVANEVRIFPLQKLNSEPSSYVEPVLSEFKKRGYRAEIVNVEYEFQRGSNKMLRIFKL